MENFYNIKFQLSYEYNTTCKGIALLRAQICVTSYINHNQLSRNLPEEICQTLDHTVGNNLMVSVFSETIQCCV